MLYSSLDAGTANTNDPPADANSYRPFKVMNSVVTNNIQKELDLIEGLSEERVLRAASQFALLTGFSSSCSFGGGFDESTML
jgi:hypothetical protein